MRTLCTYSIYLLTSDLIRFIFSYTDKHDVSSIWKRNSGSNDVMLNHVDCVTKRDVCQQKMHSCFRNIRDVLFCPKYIKNNI